MSGHDSSGPVAGAGARLLAALVPRRWQWRLGLARPRLLLRVDGDVLDVARDADGQVEVLGRWPWPMTLAELESRLGTRLSCLPRYWVVPADAVLRRELQLPAAAAARLHDVARFEVERQTPFLADQALFDVRVLGAGTGDGAMQAELVAAPRRLWEGAGLEPGWRTTLAGIDVADQDGTLGVNLLPPPLRRQPRDPMRPWPWLLALLAVVFAAMAAAQWLDNRRQALEKLRLQVDAAAPQASVAAARLQQLHERVDGLAFLDAERAATPAALQVWAELSRRVPDGTHLDRLSIAQGRLQLSGTSDDAAALVGLLQDSALWQAPALDSVQRDERERQRDRFVLNADLAGDAPLAAAR